MGKWLKTSPTQIIRHFVRTSFRYIHQNLKIEWHRLPKSKRRLIRIANECFLSKSMKLRILWWSRFRRRVRKEISTWAGRLEEHISQMVTYHGNKYKTTCNCKPPRWPKAARENNRKKKNTELVPFSPIIILQYLFPFISGNFPRKTMMMGERVYQKTIKSPPKFPPTGHPGRKEGGSGYEGIPFRWP